MPLADWSISKFIYRYKIAIALDDNRNSSSNEWPWFTFILFANSNRNVDDGFIINWYSIVLCEYFFLDSIWNIQKIILLYLTYIRYVYEYICGVFLNCSRNSSDRSRKCENFLFICWSCDWKTKTSTRKSIPFCENKKNRWTMCNLL